MRIGIDVGGMTIKIGFVDENYRITAKKIIETEAAEKSAEEIISNMVNAVKDLLSANGLEETDCARIGIAMPGTSDTKNGVVLYSNNIAWKNVPVIDLMRQKIKIPAAIANDADAAALGEVLCGAAKGYRNVVMLTLGTGVGGGVVIDQKIFNGPLTGGCELGHMVIKKDGKQCTCGRKGCLEAYASATALMDSARAELKRNPESEMYELCQKDVSRLDGSIIFQAEKAGDETAIRVVREYEENLSVGIANLINIFRPEAVILGGGVSAQKEYLTDALQRMVEPMCFGGTLTEIPRIVTSQLGNDAGIVGAAYL